MELEGVRADRAEAESGQRGYLLTGEEHALDGYEKAIEQIGARLQRLREMTADNPRQRPRLVSLQP